MHKEFLVKRGGGFTMPGIGLQSVLKIAIESLDVPTHVIEIGQF